ncbi:MAG: DNA circularization N-terminal domain-containing protein [Fibrobacter sp.]|uniref:DNA circularization N-terminal domain-containing protein n=1 Tax=Fibrobacter sp. TaxID=35828 RepID=UPI001B24345D|nr:DNA circularization N-terminal domain-containing protein [Fibrobacter sp.]MBO7060117.1 DNA circularization N-terminal domain-containing protein [Fibrobacter sp.]
MAWRNEYADSLHKVLIDTPSGTIECVGGSYAGVPFFVEETASSGGREVVTKPLPFSDSHVNEDVGKKVLSISCNIYLTGADCETKRERLEEALNKEGAFEFVHPHYGRMNARCTAYSLSFKKAEQEFISGEITFVPEQNVEKQAQSVADLRGSAIGKSDSTLSSSKSMFTEVFSIAGKAKSVVDSVAASTTKMLDNIENARGSIRSVSAFVNTLSRIRENIRLIMMSPADFANRIQNLLTLTKETVSDDDANGYVNESLIVMRSIMAKRRGSAYSSADELSSEVDRLALMSAAAMAARSVVDCSFKSVEEAREMQDSLSSVFDDAAEQAGSVEDYVTLMDLQATALKYLRDEMSKLAVVVELPLNGTRDILSVCFDCYGSLDRVDEILERNAVGDPLVMIRESLRVLSK